MNTQTQTNKQLDSATASNRIMETILQEVRLLRQELKLLLPQEDIKDYVHPEKIKNSYQKAVKKYPPVLLWK